MLTARSEVSDRIRGLDGGADDYLVKPFDFGELLARLRALIRRGPAEHVLVLAVGDLQLDRAARAVTCAGHRVELTTREFAVLELLARHAGDVVSRTQLLDEVWDGAGEVSPNVVDVYVGYLRREARAAVRPAPDPDSARSGLPAGAGVRLPIRTRLTAWYALLLAVIIAALGGFLVIQLRVDLETMADRDLRARSQQIADELAEDAPRTRSVAKAVAVLPGLCEDALIGPGFVATLTDDGGRVLGSCGTRSSGTPRVPDDALADAAAGMTRRLTAPTSARRERFRVRVSEVTARRPRRPPCSWSATRIARSTRR